MIGTEARPKLRRGVRLGYDAVRDTHVLMYPEGVAVLNETAAAVLDRCDGARTVDEITDSLASRYIGVRGADVVEVLDRLAGCRLIEVA